MRFVNKIPNYGDSETVTPISLYSLPLLTINAYIYAKKGAYDGHKSFNHQESDCRPFEFR